MAREIAKAYVQIVPSTEGIQGSIEKVLKGESRSAGESSGKSIASSLGGTIAKTVAALGIGKMVADSISSGTEYQTAMAKLGTIANPAEKSMESMAQEIAAISNQMGISQSDLAEAAYNTISATSDTAGSLAIVEQAAKLATAGFTDTDSSIRVLTTAMNAYGMSAEEVEHISDSLLTVQNLGVTTVGQMAQNMGRAIATASGYGVSMENLEAAYISTTKAGIATAESTTYISGMISELGKEGSDVAGILQEKTGKSFGKLMEETQDLGQVLQILVDSVDGDSEAFMNLWGSQEAGKAANAIVNQGLEQFSTNLGKLQTETEVTDGAYSQMTDTMSFKTELMKTKFQNLGITLFEAMYPTLERLVDKATEFVDNMDVDAITENVKTFLEGVSPLIDGIGTGLYIVATNLDTIIPLVGGLMGFSLVTKVESLAAGLLGVFSGCEALAPVIAALTGPIGLAVAAVAGFVGWIVMLWNTNEEFRANVQQVWQAVKETVVEIGEETWNNLTELWGGLTGWASETWDSTVSSISGWWTQMQSDATAVWTAVRDTITEAIESAKTAVSNAIEAIKGLFDFEIHWPKIPVPKFSIEGEFSLMPPSVPHIGVDWYDTGGIFTGPQVIGVGEKRPEFVGALDDLRTIVREESGYAGNDSMNQVMSLLQKYLPSVAKRQIVLDSGALVGELAPDMDYALGSIAARRERWN